MSLFIQSAPPAFLNHILTWGLLRAEQFAQSPESPEHIPTNIRSYIESEPETVAINIPLTATRYYLRSAELGLRRLLKSLQIEPEAGNIDPKKPDALASFFEQARSQNTLLWIPTDMGQKVMLDMIRLHQSHAEALGYFNEWMHVRSRASRGAPWDADPFQGRPDELPASIKQLQQHLLSRIALARKAIHCSVGENDSRETRVLMADGIAKAIAAFSDDGLRVEFDALPLELSIKRYLDE